jgi:hypothetical protein
VSVYLPDTDKVVAVSGEQGLAVSAPGHGQALRRVSTAGPRHLQTTLNVNNIKIWKLTKRFRFLTTNADPDLGALKLTKIYQRNMVSIKKGVPSLVCFWPTSYCKYVFQVKNNLFVTRIRIRIWLGTMNPDPF